MPGTAPREAFSPLESRVLWTLRGRSLLQVLASAVHQPIMECPASKARGKMESEVLPVPPMEWVGVAVVLMDMEIRRAAAALATRVTARLDIQGLTRVVHALGQGGPAPGTQAWARSFWVE